MPDGPRTERGSRTEERAVAERLCTDCANAHLGVYGVFCRAFREQIDNERVAEECPEFTEIPSGPVEVVK